MISLKGLHHVAIICSDIAVSKEFYCKVLGFTINQEVYREDRKSWKVDIALNGQYVIELFSFPVPPNRVSRPEARGLRHIAFCVGDIAEAVMGLDSLNVLHEAVRVDEYTGQRFVFFEDPDGLPIELYEVQG